MPIITQKAAECKVCFDCAYATYHRARPGSVWDGPVDEGAYFTCSHPRVYRDATWNPETPPELFTCRYWLQETTGFGNEYADYMADYVAGGMTMMDAAFAAGAL